MRISLLLYRILQIMNEMFDLCTTKQKNSFMETRKRENNIKGAVSNVIDNLNLNLVA